MRVEIRGVVRTSSEGADNQARGKVFERFAADVLRHLGYSPDFCCASNVSHSGMEIDIEAHHSATGVPLIGECKFRSGRIDSPKLQAFFGKYTGKWMQDKRIQGLFIAVPGLNPHAAGFWADSMSSGEMTLTLIESDRMVELAHESGLLAGLDSYAGATNAYGSPGDAWLVLAENGYYWAQFVILPSATTATAVLLLDAKAIPLHNVAAREITSLSPELAGFELLNAASPEHSQLGKSSTAVTLLETGNQVAEVAGSASCFEYQLPASPQFFFGRETRVADAADFIEAVRSGSTSIRGLLLQGASGWGKSSLALRIASAVKANGDLAMVLDSRTASNSRFVIDVVQYLARKLSEREPALFAHMSEKTITGYEGAADLVRDIGNTLAQHRRVLLLVFDQFENLFFETNALLPIRDMFLGLTDDQLPVVFGFAWKSDLLGLTDSFPYLARDAIAEKTQRLPLSEFSKADVDAMLSALEREIGGKLRSDLAFLITEYSQGLPWLLKKLCAHVVSQIAGGASQREVADSVLNVGDLFATDVEELTAQAQATLQRLAKLVPVDVEDLSEDFRPQILQSLIDRRLIVRVGSKYDIYWDIFRDYLNLGVVPVQENYMLRADVGSVSKVLRIVWENGGSISRSRLVADANLTSGGSYYNVTRDMRLMGLISVDGETISLARPFPADAEGFEEASREYLHDKLACNRSVRLLTEALRHQQVMTIEQAADLLREAHPYVSAAERTWHKYSRVLLMWMDIAELGILHKSTWTIEAPEDGIARVFRRNILRAGRSGEMALPEIRYAAIEDMAIRFAAAVDSKGPVDWSNLSSSTVAKSLSALDHLGFISRRQNSLLVHGVLLDFAHHPERRSALFREAALRRPAFAAFIDVLNECQVCGSSSVTLGQEVANKIGANWTDGTARWVAGIMLDWARAAELAHGVFYGPKRHANRATDGAKSLFDVDPEVDGLSSS